MEDYLKRSNKVKDSNVNNLIGKVVKEFFGVERKNDKGENNPLYFSVIEDIRNCVNLSLNFDVEYTGKIIREFLNDETSDVLIIHRSTDEVRKLFMSSEMDRLCVPVFRIYFGFGNNIPDEYDYLIAPNSKDLEQQIEDIYQMEIVS